MTSSKSTNTNDCYSNHIKNTKPSNLNLAIINCRSVCNKQAELNVFLALQNIDIFIGTESHLDNSILNSEVFPNTYNTYRCDRNRHGGGVFILIRKTIPSSELYTTNSDIEIVWAHIHQKSKQDVILGSFYCPPGSSISVLEELQTSVSQIKQSFPTAKIILGGDFNAPGIDWPNRTLLESYVSTAFREKLLFIAEEFHLEQIVSIPTRGCSILDLCFMSHPDNVISCESLPGLSDHNAVLVKISSQLYYYKQPPRKIHLFKKANWDEIRCNLVLVSNMYFDLNSITSRSVEENWAFIHQQYLHLIHKFVPSKTLGTRYHLPWLSSSLKRLIRKKQRLYNKAKSYQDPADWEEYKILQHKVRNLLCSSHYKYLQNAVNSASDTVNQKSFWRYIKSKRHDSTGIGSLKTPTGDVTEPSDKAEILNNHF